jgi:hypothetical protein
MKALLDAELLKMRSTRATALLVLATLLLAALTVATSVPGVMEENAWISLDDPTSWPTWWGTVSAPPRC